MHGILPKQGHKSMEHRFNFDAFGRAQNLKQVTRDQNIIDSLTDVPLQLQSNTLNVSHA